MAQRGRPKKNISEIKELISSIKPAIEPEYAIGVDKYATSQAATGNITIVTKATPPHTFTPAANWGNVVRDYCVMEVITPQELVEQHKSFKKELNSRKSPEKWSKEKFDKVQTSNYFSDYAKRKSQGGKTEKS